MSKTALQVSVEGVVKNAFRKFCHFFVKNFQFNVHEICCKFFDSNVYPPSADSILNNTISGSFKLFERSLTELAFCKV